MNEKQYSKNISLNDLCIGKSAVITKIKTDNPEHTSHLLNVGFIPGETVTCGFISPMGDPIAYIVGEVLVAIRKTDAKKIFVAGDQYDTNTI